MDLRVTLGGFAVGILIGLTGMGGGTVMTPMMVFLFHMQPAVAVGTDLVYASITKIVGAFQHIRQGTVDFKALKYLACGGVPGALAGSLMVGLLQHHLPMQRVNVLIGQCLGVVYLIVIAAMLWRWWAVRSGFVRQQERVEVPRVRMVLLGLVAGALVGLTSVGSGTLYMAVLSLIYPIAAAKLVGTDILQSVLVTGTAGIVHLAFGNTNLLMVASLLLGSVPGILIGSRLTIRIPESAIRASLVLMLGWSSWVLLAK